MPASRNAAKSSHACEKRIIRALRQLTQKLDAHSRQLFNNHDITIPQVMCLEELRERGVMTVSVLAHAIHLSPSTTVGIIDRLESKGLVKRTRNSADRRSVFVDITEKGTAFISDAPHLLHNRMHHNLKTLPEPEQTLIADSLDTLVLLMSKKV